MPRISVLPEEVARKIAAGEVIERPASVVKELLENALDAEAKKIEVSLERGGLGLIRVRDDGHGMSPEDLKLCYLPHATSKIQRPEDLLAIATLGFRGEALASIAAVSKLTIVSRPPEALLGARLEVRFGKFKELRDTGASKGTVVEVRDLFANVPARLSFLKSPRTETLKVSETVRLLALGFPEVALSLSAGQRRLFAYEPHQGRKGLLAQLTGLTIEDFLEDEFAKGPYRVRLLLSRPQAKFPTARHLYLLVNRRAVRNRLLLGALLQGAAAAFPKGQYPAAVLALNLPATLVDVNVHPAKWEVRFREEREVFALVRESVEKTLAPKVSISFQKTAPEEEDLPLGPESPSLRQNQTGSSLGPPREDAFSTPKPLTRDLRVQEKAPFYRRQERDRPLGDIARKYYLFEVSEGLLILDYHAAHERLLYEKIRQDYEKKGLLSQKLLFPVVLRLSSQALERLAEHQQVLSRLGYEVLQAGPEEIRVVAVPSLVGEGAAEALLTVLEEDFGAPPGHILERVFATLACRAAIKAGDEITAEEALNLWQEIKSRELSTCPHGRPLYWMITHEELERRLGRKV